MIRKFFIFILGTLILSPVVVFGVSGSFWGFVAALLWVAVISMSYAIFPKFWREWVKINMEYVAIFEGRK